MLLRRGCVAGTGLLDSSMAEDPAAELLSRSHGGTSPGPAAAEHAVMEQQDAPAIRGDAAAGAAMLAAENDALKQQLQQAVEAAGKWQGLHAQLHAFCVEQVLPG